MTRYSPERKEAALSKMLPPQSRTVSEVASEEDIPYNTLYTWLKTAQKHGVKMTTSQTWTAESKLAVIIETGTLTGSELASYCRENGLYPEQIQIWKEESVQPNKIKDKASIKEAQADKREIKSLKKELRRKEKALAETPALLVLRKKFNALYDLDDEES